MTHLSLLLPDFSGAMFFKWDSDMYDAENKLSARVNTSDINEELGQIEYLFSDKTGQLLVNTHARTQTRKYTHTDSCTYRPTCTY